MKSQTQIDLDISFYRNFYSDLKFFSDTQLLAHYKNFGQKEGRQSAHLAVRENLVTTIETHSSVLEIGPFCAPTINTPSTKYLDIMTHAQLTKRAIDIGLPIDKVPEIDFVSPDGSLNQIDEKFDAIFSSHCIEHQPNLVKHLNEVESHLNEGGCYFLIVPDKRYCFDAHLPPSKITEIVEAHFSNPKTHSLSSVIDHRALTTHNDARKHWETSYADEEQEISAARIQAAIDEYRAADGAYVDVHAWQFTPASFKQNITLLNELGLINFSDIVVYGTPHLRLEFVAMLKK